MDLGEALYGILPGNNELDLLNRATVIVVSTMGMLPLEKKYLPEAIELYSARDGFSLAAEMYRRLSSLLGNVDVPDIKGKATEDVVKDLETVALLHDHSADLVYESAERFKDLSEEHGVSEKDRDIAIAEESGPRRFRISVKKHEGCFRDHQGVYAELDDIARMSYEGVAYEEVAKHLADTNGELFGHTLAKNAYLTGFARRIGRRLEEFKRMFGV